MELALWSSWGQMAGAVVATVIVYLATLVAVRIVGRRSTAQLSAFDALVTVALGTAMGTTALPPHPAVIDGLVVLATLLVLQVSIAALRRRSELAQRLTDFVPEVVVRDGEIEKASGFGSARLTDAEIRSELRRHGVQGLATVGMLVLEPDGRFSLLPVDEMSSGAASHDSDPADGGPRPGSRRNDTWTL